MKKIEIFFLGLFPEVIMNNQIVASILSILSMKLTILKDEIDDSLNIDI